jgi:nucleotide-binding universal stress UspA family protein
MITFAYDGTINGDWVSRYAVRLSSRHPQRRLRLVLVDEARLPRRELESRVSRIGAECGLAGVAFESAILPRARDVFTTLDRETPTGSGAFLVLGTRVGRRSGGLLAGSVGESMLRAGRRNVLVVRVLHPGLLGAPRQLLLPVGGHRRGFASGIPFLRLFAADIAAAHIVNVRPVGSAAYRALTQVRSEGLRSEGARYCRRVEREIVEALGLPAGVLRTHVVVSDDTAREIVVLAGRLRSELIFLGASERGLSHRLLHSSSLERVLRDAPCDVAVYRGLA